MHHVELERVVLAEDVVLGWGVHVELDKLERVVADCGGAVGYDLNGRAQVLEEDLIDLGDRDLGLVGSLGNGGIWGWSISKSRLGADVSVVWDLPMSMGDWFLPVLQASFSGAREAQLKGPLVGP